MQSWIVSSNLHYFSSVTEQEITQNLKKGKQKKSEFGGKSRYLDTLHKRNAQRFFTRSTSSSRCEMS